MPVPITATARPPAPSAAEFSAGICGQARTLRHDWPHVRTFLTDTPQAQLYFEPPGAETQAIFLNFVDRFTASPLRLVTLWDDHPARFSSHGITPPEGAFVGSRTATVEAGLPELRGRKDVYLLIASELGSAGMLTANLSGMVSPAALVDRLATDFGRQFVRFTSPRVHVAEYKRSKPARSGADVRLEDISDLVGHSTSVTETVYRHEIRPALTDNATAVNRILTANATKLACPCSRKPLAPQLAPENKIQKSV